MSSANSIPTLEQLSRLLLRMGQAGRVADAASFIGHVMEVLQSSLGFQFGWCGLVAERFLSHPMLQCVNGIDLPKGFVSEFFEVAPLDEWGRGVIMQSAKVHRWSGFVEEDVLVDEFVRRHDMFHGMAQSLRGAFGARSFVVAVYRERGASGFTDTEADVFRHCCYHIGSLWADSMRGALAADDLADPSKLALVRNDGLLLYAGSEMCDVLNRSGSQWDGTHLPVDLVAAVATQAAQNLKIGNACVTIRRKASHFQLTVTDGKPSSPLSPREWRVARLFASGQSHKAIARELALSPATVRSYLQSAYRTLGVCNKIHLGLVLASLSEG